MSNPTAQELIDRALDVATDEANALIHAVLAVAQAILESQPTVGVTLGEKK